MPGKNETKVFLNFLIFVVAPFAFVVGLYLLEQSTQMEIPPIGNCFTLFVGILLFGASCAKGGLSAILWILAGIVSCLIAVAVYVAAALPSVF